MLKTASAFAATRRFFTGLIEAESPVLKIPENSGSSIEFTAVELVIAEKAFIEESLSFSSPVV